MNWKLFGKVLLLVAIAVTTFIVTSEVLAQKKKRNASSPTVVFDQVRTTVGPNQRGAVPSSPSMGITSVNSLKVELLAEGIHVSGQARVRDLRPNVAFVWSIRVRDPVSGKVVAENRYDTQIFQPRQDTHELTPTFDDTIRATLPPGIYKIELVLYEVPPGGVGLLNDPDMREHQLMAKNTVKVAIGL
ncbi:MAG: hypothetical protein ACHRXM_13940 [Isosphaerales bacterium]